jgi:4-hydroxybenzoate polyprenyltransferase
VANAILQLIRPKQWSKNLLVFAALLFTGHFGNSGPIVRALAAFVAMCAISSSAYILNDLLDVERDRAHPTKKNRPIASGRVSTPVAVVLCLLLLALGVGLAVWLGPGATILVGFYILIQISYNAIWKQVPLSDVFIIATGFILRAILGAAALDVKISGWLLFCTGSLALMLGFGKRRHEYLLQGDRRSKSREVLAGYNLETLTAFVVMCSVCAAQGYAMYALESQTAKTHPDLVITTVFVFYGVFRYVYVALRNNEGGEPENLLFRDPHILVTILLFVITAVLAMKGLLHLGMIEGEH